MSKPVRLLDNNPPSKRTRRTIMRYPKLWIKIRQEREQIEIKSRDIFLFFRRTDKNNKRKRENEALNKRLQATFTEHAIVTTPLMESNRPESDPRRLSGRRKGLRTPLDIGAILPVLRFQFTVHPHARTAAVVANAHAHARTRTRTPTSPQKMI